MTNNDELRYIQAYARIIGVKEDEAAEYAQRKGLNALVENADQLLTTKTQREKYNAFIDLYRMSSSINSRNPIIKDPDTAAAFFHSVTSLLSSPPSTPATASSTTMSSPWARSTARSSIRAKFSEKRSSTRRTPF